MKIVLTGGTGFIGRPLASALASQGHELVILTRDSGRVKKQGMAFSCRESRDGSARWFLSHLSVSRRRHLPVACNHGQVLQSAAPAQRAGHQLLWNPPQVDDWKTEINGADAVVNLAGESVAAKRWTRKQKLRILESRCDATQAIVQAIQRASRKPKVLVNASAVGYYGPRGSEAITEHDEAGHDFLAKTCKAWEAHALRAEDFGVRVVRLRIGVVLEKGGGALGKMIPPFRFFLGGPLGNGRQWVSWIHREDVIGLIAFALAHDDVRGPLNATAPFPVTMNELAQTLGKIMRRPALAPVPSIALRILLGDMAQMLLTGQKVLPEKALGLGYKFRYSTLKAALEAILKPHDPTDSPPSKNA